VSDQIKELREAYENARAAADEVAAAYYTAAAAVAADAAYAFIAADAADAFHALFAARDAYAAAKAALEAAERENSQ
jgi:hypothetical protein